MANLRQNPDGSMGFYSDAEGKELGKFGGPKTPVGGLGASANFRQDTIYHIPLVGVGSTGLTCGMANIKLSDDAIVITDWEINVTATAPVCTFDVGFAATGPGVPNTTLIAANQVTQTPTPTTLNGNTSPLHLLMPAGAFIGVTAQTGTCAAFRGDLYLTGYKA